MTKTKKLLVLILLSTFYFLLSTSVQAAQLSVEVPATTVEVGDTVNIRIQLNTEGATINATDLTLFYPPLFKVTNISKAGSFIQLWLQEPGYTDNAIFLSGGSPGGISSKNATIATVTIKALAVGDGAIGLGPSSSVLLNDGNGTSVPLSLHTPTIHVVARPASKTPNISGNTSQHPKKQIATDFIPPLSFDIVIGKDAALFGGKYFASFFTTDPGSGVDHYEIKEGDGVFRIAQSPYLLKDQNRHSVIRGRAYDTANNYREAVYPNLLIRIWWVILRIFGR